MDDLPLLLDPIQRYCVGYVGNWAVVLDRTTFRPTLIYKGIERIEYFIETGNSVFCLCLLTFPCTTVNSHSEIDYQTTGHSLSGKTNLAIYPANGEWSLKTDRDSNNFIYSYLAHRTDTEFIVTLTD